MTKVYYTSRKVVTEQAVLDTDLFSPEQWREFIKANVPWHVIKRAIETDLMPLDYLKAKAIAGFQLRQEFNILDHL